ncbi:unnamed protein product [Rotaria sp. Silwood2]|nr:unnamed protein product [Rotaria sp. Silwood2]
MSLEEFEVNVNGKVNKQQRIVHCDPNINVRNQKVEIADSFTYLGAVVTADQKFDMELETRLSKATKAFNMLRNVVWYRKTISINAKLRIFRSCVLPVLLYASETWCPTSRNEQQINTFYMKCLRTILGLKLGDRVPNQTILDLSGQPKIAEIMCRNRLRVNSEESYATLISTDKWPSQINNINITVIKPKFIPDSFALVVRYVPLQYNDEYVKEEIERNLQSAENVRRIQYHFQRRTNDFRFIVKDLREYNSTLKLGRISIGNTFCTITLFLAEN